jgi:hypothetical protein
MFGAPIYKDAEQCFIVSRLLCSWRFSPVQGLLNGLSNAPKRVSDY